MTKMNAQTKSVSDAVARAPLSRKDITGSACTSLRLVEADGGELRVERLHLVAQRVDFGELSRGAHPRSASLKSFSFGPCVSFSALAMPMPLTTKSAPARNPPPRTRAW